MKDILGVVNYLDDILVTRETDEEHLTRLELVLSQLQEAGLWLKQSDCSFLQAEVNYLGHVIEGNGIHPDPKKVEAINGAPTPQNVS